MECGIANMETPSSAPAKIRSFTDLDAWKFGHTLVLSIYQCTENFPATEQYGLTNQLRRAPVSITSNLAEGFHKRSVREKTKFYTIALASLTEVQNQLLIARDIKYLTNEIFSGLAEHSVRTSKIINGLIKSTQRMKKV